MQVRIALTAATATAALALPTVAQAHVTVNPKSVSAGTFQVLGVRVPNERDHTSTVKLELRLPHGFTFLSYEPQAGWKVKIVKRKLETPIEVFGEPVDEEIAKVVFSGSRKGLGKIRPGQFREFRLSTLVPGKAGDVLTFKALQTYANGEVVRWTAGPAADTPAPQITLTEAASAHGAARALARAAHAELQKRTPKPGSTQSVVRTVSAKFAGSLLGGSIEVRRGGKLLTPASSGLKPGDRRVLWASFSKALASGTYKVSWDVTSGDGHRQDGSWSFVVAR